MKIRYQLFIVLISMIGHSIAMQNPQQPKKLSDYLLDNEGFKKIKARRQGNWLKLEGLNLMSIEGLNSVPDIKNVKVLQLYNNPLKRITREFLYVAPNLETLTLNDTQLEDIEPNAFEDLTQLKTLSLADNKLTKISSGMLNGLTALTDLDLSNNQLTILDANTFSGVPNVERLMLINNKFTNVDPAVFSALPNLKSMNLKQNKSLSQQNKKAISDALPKVKVLF